MALAAADSKASLWLLGGVKMDMHLILFSCFIIEPVPIKTLQVRLVKFYVWVDSLSRLNVCLGD